MPSPQSGSPGALVPPMAPDVAKDADDAQPGQVETIKQSQRETGTGKYGSQKVKPYQKPNVKPGQVDPAKDSKNTFIEVLLVDKNGDPVPGERYRITLPDDSVAEGALGADGLVRIAGLETPGNCKIEFPDLDGKAWSAA